MGFLSNLSIYPCHAEDFFVLHSSSICVLLIFSIPIVSMHVFTCADPVTFARGDPTLTTLFVCFD